MRTSRVPFYSTFHSLQMSSVIVILAAVGFAEGFGLAEMISNYAKVTTNNGLKTNNVTYRFESNATSNIPEGYTVEPLTNVNETDYEDFDDLEASTENSISRQVSITPGKMLKVFNGLFSLLALMNNFSGRTSSIRGSRREVGREQTTEEYSPTGQPRYLPETATKKFKYQKDQEKQPIGNYPPYNPLTANEAETYPKNGKSSYDADLKQHKQSTSMSEYMAQNNDLSQDSYSYEAAHQNPVGGWNGITQDYTNYGGGQSWSDSESKNKWNTPEEHPAYQFTLPEKKPHNYHDLVLADHQEDHHHHLEHFHHHPEDFHHHDHHLIEDEDRESKHPYSYYFLGRKLWYIPLIFSVYFILYVGALVLKSVARHKIQFPDKLWDLKDEHYKHRRYRKVDEVTQMYDNAMDSAKNKFM